MADRKRVRQHREPERAGHLSVDPFGEAHVEVVDRLDHLRVVVARLEVVVWVVEAILEYFEPFGVLRLGFVRREIESCSVLVC